MDHTHFDSLTSSLSTTLTRRRTLRGLVAGALATVVGISALHEETEARRRRRKGGKRKSKKQNQNQNQNGKLQPGERCETTAQCVSGYICEVPVNGSNSDTYCSGGPGAICGAPNGDGDDTYPYCAVGHDCVPSGSGYICQAVPDL
jgi:hypothetical protein